MTRFLPPVAAALALTLCGCVSAAHYVATAPALSGEPQTLDLFEPARGRAVPVRLYPSPNPGPAPLAVISHGYGGQNSDYGFVAAALQRRGYLVAAIQHELQGDPPLPSTGDLAQSRRANWERGADIIGFVVQELRARGWAAGGPFVLVGHSNGGDMSAVFARAHPAAVAALITLDNRRAALPRTAHPHVCTIRSADQVADPGVLPTETEQARFNIQIDRVEGLKHDNMWDGGATAEQKARVEVLIAGCLARL